MTTPTQAQIKKVREVLNDYLQLIYEIPDEAITAALTAAAEVGASPYAPEAKVAMMRANERDDATIERCAQVAEKEPVYGNRQIAAAIRALKDKP